MSAIIPTETFNFLDTQTANIYIGETTTGTSGQIIQIGAPALTTVKVGAISLKDTTIDALSATSAIFIANSARTGILRINSASTSTNQIYFGSIGTTTIIDGNVLTLGSSSPVIRVGATQTSGTIEIATSATRTGALYINSTTGATNSVYLGASGTTTVIDGNTLTLGSASTATTNTNTFTSTGLIRANGGLTLGNGYGISTGTTSYSPGSTQIGYYNQIFNTLVNFASATLTDIVFTSSAAMPIGIYQITWSMIIDTWSPATRYLNFGVYPINATFIGFPNTPGTNFTQAIGSSISSSVTLSGILKVNVAGGYALLRGTTNTGTTCKISANSCSVVYIKIA